MGQLKTKIIAYLDKYSMKHSNLGFMHLASAIELVAMDRRIIQRMTTRLYPEIAEGHGTTPSRVERAIRHSITTSTAGKITNSEFIARAVDELMIGGGADARSHA